MLLSLNCSGSNALHTFEALPLKILNEWSKWTGGHTFQATICLKSNA